jgi:hypothetical protein
MTVLAPPQLSSTVPGRRALAALDRRSAHLAELHHICALLQEARGLVQQGWVQNGWYAIRGADGVVRTSGLTLHGPVVGACLVGAVVHAGGGAAAAGSQPVQRALELTWHTLTSDGPIERWCPAPAERVAHVRQLTAWNDADGRTSAEVAELLGAASSSVSR